jgi:peptidoglycan hydrolase-like protein with peptidoglycan-binding domain
VVVNPTQTMTYSLTCSGAGGARAHAEATVTVGVAAAPTTSVTSLGTPVGSVSGTSGQILSNLVQGNRGSKVLLLQQKLSRLGFLSSSYVTGYYGGFTAEAVRTFQCKKGLACSGSVLSNGYGAVGPRTRGVLNAL